MPLGDQILSQILEALYQAPLEPARWQEFLRLTAEAAGGHSASLGLYDFKGAQATVALQWRVDPEATRLYEEHYGAVDAWRDAALKAFEWLGTSERFLPFEELKRTEIYNELYGPYDIPHAIFAAIERSPSRLMHFGIYRGLRKGAFDDKNLEVLRFLRPHIQRAYRLHSELSASRNRSAGLQAALDSLAAGVILLGPRMQVVSMNRAAERLIAANSGLLVAKGRLRAERAEESGQLEKLTNEAALTSSGKGLCSGGAMAVSRRDRPPLQVMVSPVRGFDLGESHPVRAVVFVNDPGQRARPADYLLRGLFGLTPAECRVALLLADGHAPTEIAGMVGVSRNTLKSQLGSIYRKTGASRQSQLVRLLLQFSLPVGHGSA